MKKLLFTGVLGFLTVSCSSTDEIYSLNEINPHTESIVQKGPPLVITESVDLEIFETACYRNRKQYQAIAKSTDVMNRSRTVSYKIIENSSNSVMHTGQFVIPAGLNQSNLDYIFPDINFTTDITYEVTNVEIYPYTQDSYGNTIYDPLIGLYNYGTGVRTVNNCQRLVIGN